MKNFTITVYAFHLRHTLTHTPNEVIENANILWENLAKIGESSFASTSLKDFKSKLICYENAKYEPKREVGIKTEYLTDNNKEVDLGSLSTTDGFKINGDLKPFLVHDTYAVDLNLYPESVNIDINISQLQHFKPEPNNPVKQCQVYILLNNQQANTVQLIDNACYWLRDLLCCYHKILFLNYQVSQSYQDARTVYSYLENKIQEFQTLISNPKTQISDLKKLLSEIPQKSFDYTRCLQDLQIHNTSIQTNIRNYRTCLNKITAINNQTSPKFWQDFLDKECQKWQEQVQTDINYLTPGQELFGQFVDTIRGIVETEQTESDRSLETTVQVFGIGFGGGAIFSGIITTHIDKINSPLLPKNYFSASLILSIIATLGWTLLVWLVIWITKRK